MIPRGGHGPSEQVESARKTGPGRCTDPAGRAGACDQGIRSNLKLRFLTISIEFVGKQIGTFGHKVRSTIG